MGEDTLLFNKTKKSELKSLMGSHKCNLMQPCRTKQTLPIGEKGVDWDDVVGYGWWKGKEE